MSSTRIMPLNKERNCLIYSISRPNTKHEWINWPCCCRLGEPRWHTCSFQITTTFPPFVVSLRFVAQQRKKGKWNQNKNELLCVMHQRFVLQRAHSSGRKYQCISSKILLYCGIAAVVADFSHNHYPGHFRKNKCDSHGRVEDTPYATAVIRKT